MFLCTTRMHMMILLCLDLPAGILDRKHDPSAITKSGCRYRNQSSPGIEIPPDLRAFFDGNHFVYVSAF